MPKQKQKGRGWAILAVALTNMPVARQKGHPISIVERDGTEYLRIPLVRKSKIKYRDQVLTFDQDKFDQMLKNHHDQVWDAPPYVRVGHGNGPGLAWFAQVQNEDPHGEMVQEQDWLVAYALPADEDVKRAERGYKFASIDLHPDYNSNQMELAFSSDDFEEITEEETMSGDKDKDNEVTLTKEEYQDLMSKSVATAANETTIKLQAQVDALAAEKKALEAERAEDKKQVYLSKVESIISAAKARKSKDGKYALPAFVLNTAESILKFEALDNGVIKLDRASGNGAIGYMDYVAQSISYLLSNMPIEAMATEGSTTHGESSPDKDKLMLGMTEAEFEETLLQDAKNYHTGGIQ